MFARVFASRLVPLGRVLLGTGATLASTAAVVTPQKEEQKLEQQPVTAPVSSTPNLFNNSLINRELKSINALAAQKYGNNEAFAIFSPQTDGEADDDGEIKSIKFSSYMVPEAELKPGQLRLLEVDNKVVVPVNTHIRILITAKDVLHSWAVPAFGIKMDAVPGRLNQTTLYVKREGVYYGQCSELCGVNHGFMPIVIKAVSPEEYIKWLKAKLEDE